VASIALETTMETRTIALAGGATVLFVILVGGSLLADNSSLPNQEVPQGFSYRYIIIETTKGAVTVLRDPKLRALDRRIYVVGATVTLTGVTDDEFFSSTHQWVCLEDVRRMGEFSDDNTLGAIESVAGRRRMEEERRKHDR
jgi:hypothetical protein